MNGTAAAPHGNVAKPAEEEEGGSSLLDRLCCGCFNPSDTSNSTMNGRRYEGAEATGVRLTKATPITAQPAPRNERFVDIALDERHPPSSGGPEGDADTNNNDQDLATATAPKLAIETPAAEASSSSPPSNVVVGQENNGFLPDGDDSVTEKSERAVYSSVDTVDAADVQAYLSDDGETPREARPTALVVPDQPQPKLKRETPVVTSEDELDKVSSAKGTSSDDITVPSPPPPPKPEHQSVGEVEMSTTSSEEPEIVEKDEQDEERAPERFSDEEAGKKAIVTQGAGGMYDDATSSEEEEEAEIVESAVDVNPEPAPEVDEKQPERAKVEARRSIESVEQHSEKSAEVVAPLPPPPPPGESPRKPKQLKEDEDDQPVTDDDFSEKLI